MDIMFKEYKQGDKSMYYINSRTLERYLHIDKKEIKKKAKLLKEDNNEYVIFDNRKIYFNIDGYKKLLNMTPRFNVDIANQILISMIKNNKKLTS